MCPALVKKFPSLTACGEMIGGLEPKALESQLTLEVSGELQLSYAGHASERQKLSKLCQRLNQSRLIMERWMK